MLTITRNEVRRLIDAALAGAVDPRIREALVASAISGFQASGTRLVEEPGLPERLAVRRSRIAMPPMVGEETDEIVIPWSRPAHAEVVAVAPNATIRHELVRRYNAKAKVLEVAAELEASRDRDDHPMAACLLREAADWLRAAYEEER